uniref:(California timema) hypothetical protein n=1 Tax=Timema californicum TaxID=61474 RepID=A0A7R9JEH7_TIMCA|nr:unnamed protein product [Timema californicum]
MMFRRLHTLYTDVVCNPFYIPGDPILSKNFDKSEVALRVSHSSLMSSDKMKPGSGDWAVTINFLEEAAITSLYIGSSVNLLIYSCVAVLAMLVAMSMSYPNHRRRSMQVIPLLGDQQSEESGYAPQVLLPAQDLQAAATGHEHLGRVQIKSIWVECKSKCIEGQPLIMDMNTIAPHGFWVKQPADDSHHH